MKKCTLRQNKPTNRFDKSCLSLFFFTDSGGLYCNRRVEVVWVGCVRGLERRGVEEKDGCEICRWGLRLGKID